MFFRVLLLSLSAWGACISTAVAQEPLVPATRADALRLEREEKARSLRPHEPNLVEQSMAVAEDRLVPLLLMDGLHWRLGSLTTGSGFAFGGGYRHRRLLDRQAAFNVWAAASLKRYWALEARFDLPALANGRVVASAYARRHHYPAEEFFGVGPDARRRDQSTFSLGNSLVGAQAGLRPWRRLTLGAGYEYSRPRPGPGTSDDSPSIAGRFDDQTAPGLNSSPTLHRTLVFAEFDSRQPKHARTGGLYRAAVSRYREPTGAFTFTRTDLELRQYASILAERRVFAFRLFATTSSADEGSRVPFYLMPALGGHDTLRGFRDYRFRGPHALLTQSEYRWEVWSGLDAALFYDAGKVAIRRAALDLRNLEDAYGFGFRFHTAGGVLLRIDAGFGSRDGRHLYVVFGDEF